MCECSLQLNAAHCQPSVLSNQWPVGHKWRIDPKFLHEYCKYLLRRWWRLRAARRSRGPSRRAGRPSARKKRTSEGKCVFRRRADSHRSRQHIEREENWGREEFQIVFRSELLNVRIGTITSGEISMVHLCKLLHVIIDQTIHKVLQR